jgi:ribonuclease inhibitor
VDERRSSVEINLADVKTSEELQSLLARALDFPDWYGCNWDAFWDAITGLVEMPRRLRLVGWAGFAARLPEDARLLRECLEDAEADEPASAAQVEYA